VKKMTGVVSSCLSGCLLGLIGVRAFGGKNIKHALKLKQCFLLIDNAQHTLGLHSDISIVNHFVYSNIEPNIYNQLFVSITLTARVLNGKRITIFMQDGHESCKKQNR
jgi:hypothetical protein